MRNLYKLVSWDYGTNEGKATDGTSFEGELMLFNVRSEDLPKEYNGFLNINEIFSAYEDSAHNLLDIVIERGPRAPVQPLRETTRYTDDQIESLVYQQLSMEAQINKAITQSGQNIPLSDYHPAPSSPNSAAWEGIHQGLVDPRKEIWDTINNLMARVERIEALFNIRRDDHK